MALVGSRWQVVLQIGRGVVVAAAMLTASMASAGRGGGKLGVLGVKASGVPETLVADLEQEVLVYSAKAWGNVVPREKLLAQMVSEPFADACSSGPCLGELRRVTGVLQVLILEVHGDGSNYSMVASVVDTLTGVIVRQVTQTCMACSAPEVVAMGGRMPGALRGTSAVVKAKSNVVSELSLELGRANDRRNTMKWTGFAFVGAAAVLGATGGYLVSRDQERWGYSALAGAVGTGFGGLLMLQFSGEF